MFSCGPVVKSHYCSSFFDRLCGRTNAIRGRKIPLLLANCLNGLIRAGFESTGVTKPESDPAFFCMIAGLENELRRPMLLVCARKK